MPYTLYLYPIPIPYTERLTHYLIDWEDHRLKMTVTDHSYEKMSVTRPHCPYVEHIHNVMYLRPSAGEVFLRSCVVSCQCLSISLSHYYYHMTPKEEVLIVEYLISKGGKGGRRRKREKEETRGRERQKTTCFMPAKSEYLSPDAQTHTKITVWVRLIRFRSQTGRSIKTANLRALNVLDS